MQGTGSTAFRPVLGIALALACMIARAGDPPTLRLEAGSASRVTLGRHLDILRDETTHLTLDDVRLPAQAARFVRSDRDWPSAGATTAAYWYRLRLLAPSASADAEYVLELSYPQLDEVDVYLLQPDGSRREFISGDKRHTPPGQLAAPWFAFPVRLSATVATDVYLRIRTSGRHDVSLTLSSAAAFQEHATAAALWDGLFFGVLLVMILYNAIIALWTRDSAYRYYVAYLALVTIAVFIAGGYARQHGNDLADNAPALINASFPYLWNAGLLFALLFARDFLQTRVQAPRLHRAITLLIAAGILAMAVQPWQAHATQARVGYVYAALSSSLLLTVAAALSLRGVRSARFYLLSWIVLLSSLVLNVLDAFGAIALAAFGTHAVKAGIALDITILSLALADKINTERREKLAARELALEHSERVGRLRQFLPERVADLVGGGDQSLLAPKRREVTVLVMDLRGFTPFAEAAAPDAVMAVLREFYDAMGRIVDRNAGTVEHFAGDSMLVFFNAPLETPAPGRKAVETALEMRAAFAALREAWRGRGHELGMGVGIASGEATIGAIGFAGRSQYAAIGAVTNLASRLCGIAQHDEILTTPSVLAAAGPVRSEDAGERPVKGFSKPVTVVRVLAPA
jgi:class 3 adenylate cyclase